MNEKQLLKDYHGRLEERWNSHLTTTEGRKKDMDKIQGYIDSMGLSEKEINRVTRNESIGMILWFVGMGTLIAVLAIFF